MTGSDFLDTARVFYDTVARDYTEHFGDWLVSRPFDRAMLAGFAELVGAGAAGPVADIGCGDGRLTAYLDGLGLSVFGLDLSSAMVALARNSYPHLRFDEGSMTALDLADGSLGGLLASYSIIHVPRERLPGVFAEFHRVLAPGGHLMLSFQVGDTSLRVDRPFGHEVALDFRRQRPEWIAEALGRAGFVVRARLLREPDEGVEQVPQAYVVARKPVVSVPGPPSPAERR
ncbi:class I SAM-dependent methyltransferase [Streptomyces sp. NPDC048272]|uniref:class I SAM-dependent DNA methyltransferase n=1 Tax=Streptomyces sp. NPDC048272 TaxID=3154616 RepID=UPI00343C34F7